MKDARAWIGLLVSLASALFLINSVDHVELLAALKACDPLLVLACVATLPLTMYLKAYRWRLFFAERERLPMRGLLSALYLGYMANTILPLRAGELLRAYLVGETERVTKTTVLATVLVEKLFDLGTMALFLFLLRFVMSLPDWADAAAWISGLGLTIATVGLVVALATRRQALRLAHAAETRLEPLRHLQAASLLQTFLDGLAFVRDGRLVLLVVFWSLTMWAVSGLTVYLGLLAVGIRTSVSVAAFALVVTNLGMAVPSAPGYVGVYHSAVVVALEPFGIDRSQALAAAIVLHALVFGTFILGGVYYLVLGRRADGTPLGLGKLVDRARSGTPSDPWSH